MKTRDDAVFAMHPDALRIAREFKGLTQSELARRSGVARQQIANLETAATKNPTELTVRAIASALELQPRFLARCPCLPPKANVLHFRGKPRVTQRSCAQLLARASVWMTFTQELRSRCAKLPPDAFHDVRDAESVEDAAARTRVAWGLREDAPIHNVVRLLERAGALVGVFEGGEKGVDAFSWHADGPQILCNVDREMPSRTRFNLLHEAGHLILHKGRATGDKETEAEANRFASAFLLPRRAFWQEFPRHGSRLNWDGMIQMKERWGASIQAIIVRAHDLKLINDAEYRRAFIILSARGWRTREPAESAEVERPELIPRLLEALASERGFSPMDFDRELGIPVSVISELSGTDVSRLVPRDHSLVRMLDVPTPDTSRKS